MTLATANLLGPTGSVAPPADDAQQQRETNPGKEFHCASKKTVAKN